MIHQSTTNPSKLSGIALLSILVLFSPACSHPEEADHDDHGEESHDEGGHEEGGHEEDGHEEGTVDLTDKQVQAAGIRVMTATGGEAVSIMSMPAVAAVDADAITHINPKAAGIVRSINKHLGDRVEQGELLCVIDSIELGRSVSELVRSRALVEAAETTLEREGKLFQRRIETAELMLIGAVTVNQNIFDREKDLQEQAVSTIRPLLEAERALRSSELTKDRELIDLQADRDARLLALEVQLIERRIDLDASLNALKALGVDPKMLEAMVPGSPLLAGTYELRAPRSGIVSGKHTTTGEFVDSETKLYTLEDLSGVWIIASAFEKQIQSVRIGQTGRIRLDAFPQKTFEGEVTFIGYEVDAASRSLVVRFALENSDIEDWPEKYPIRPGMFGRVDLVIASTYTRVVLPESAVVHEDEGDFIFVRLEPGEFERRLVTLGTPAEDMVPVLTGIEPGEEIVVEGTFQLKSALRSSELGGGHSH